MERSPRHLLPPGRKSKHRRLLGRPDGHTDNCESFISRFQRWVCVLGVCLAVLAAAALAPAPLRAEVNDTRAAVHTVYKGQTLGMIAKRYRVSVAAICNATGIAKNSPIRPGDRLVIPALADKDGSQARQQRGRLLGSGSKPQTTARADAPRLHVVREGETLGGIAQQYSVTLAALSHANAKGANNTIRVGEKLVIPQRNDPRGQQARQLRPKLLSSANRSMDALRQHTIARGQTLGAIARRYGVSVKALAHANAIRPTDAIRAGDELVIPAPWDLDGQAARQWRQTRASRTETASDEPQRNWRVYRKPAWRRGYITLSSPNGRKRWSGYVVGPGNVLLPLARKKVTEVLASWRTGKTTTIDARLVRLIAQVSDTFGGRTIRVVSGYREHSHAARSRHPRGRALDFSVEGVPNWAVRDYLRQLANVGVGYYPNSSFVHLDVREGSMYWVDVSKPGEPPRYTYKARGQVKRP